jgi:hypothetical protein
MMPIPKNPPSISEGFSFEEIVKGIQELTILAKENTVSDPILEKECRETSPPQLCGPMVVERCFTSIGLAR